MTTAQEREQAIRGMLTGEHETPTAEVPAAEPAPAAPYSEAPTQEPQAPEPPPPEPGGEPEAATPEQLAPEPFYEIDPDAAGVSPASEDPSAPPSDGVPTDVLGAVRERFPDVTAEEIVGLVEDGRNGRAMRRSAQQEFEAAKAERAAALEAQKRVELADQVVEFIGKYGADAAYQAFPELFPQGGPAPSPVGMAPPPPPMPMEQPAPPQYHHPPFQSHAPPPQQPFAPTHDPAWDRQPEVPAHPQHPASPQLPPTSDPAMLRRFEEMERRTRVAEESGLRAQQHAARQDATSRVTAALASEEFQVLDSFGERDTLIRRVVDHAMTNNSNLSPDNIADFAIAQARARSGQLRTAAQNFAREDLAQRVRNERNLPPSSAGPRRRAASTPASSREVPEGTLFSDEKARRASIMSIIQQGE